MDTFLDSFSLSLNKRGEELCGDQVKLLRNSTRTIIVLSDGLGSGVKASILATLTTEIIMTMLKADAPLTDVIETVIGTLPIDRVRQIAYATFTIVEIDHASGNFKVINFDNPPILFFKKGKRVNLEQHVEQILDKKITTGTGTLAQNDFLGVISDGILYAGLGVTLNFGWGWENVARYIEELFLLHPHTAETVVRKVVTKTRSLYGGDIGDDATFVGVYVRQKNSLIIFTGPPLDPADDSMYAEEVLNFAGRKVVCGGTTGSIIANYLAETIETDISTLRREVPPIGLLDGIDLLTEGMITMSKTLEYLRYCAGEAGRLPVDHNGAVLLAREILQADSIYFLVGQKINEFYQNPLLPHNISLRKNLIKELSDLLRSWGKEIKIEYC